MKRMFSLMLCFAMALSLMAVPANACTISGLTDDGEPNVIPCEEVEQNGYCTMKTINCFDETLMTVWGNVPNPYYKSQSTTSEAKPNTSGYVMGGATGDPSYDLDDILQPIDGYFRDFVDGINRKDYADIIDYENMTVEYVDKNGKPTGYKTVIFRSSNDNCTVHYDPNGNELTGNLHKIDWTAENPFANCTSGTTSSTVKPSADPEVKYFDDVPADAWYAEAVNALATSGIIKGFDDGLFHPNDYVTLGQLATIIYRIGKNEDPSGRRIGNYNYASFGPDYDWHGFDHWAAYAMYTLAEAKVGYSSAYPIHADDIANRGEAVQAIMALIEDAGIEYKYAQAVNYTNISYDIPDWDIITDDDRTWNPARIRAAYNYGIVHGVDPAGTFNPRGSLTRAELCQMLYNAGLTQYTPAEMRSSRSGVLG